MPDKVCPVCGENMWESFLEINTRSIITGDQRIIPGTLEKNICKKCRLATNAKRFTKEQIKRLYGKEYILNTLGKEEHNFFTESGAVSRSQVFFDWIEPWLPKKFESLLEIGCGEGNLLVRFNEAFKNSRIMGIEGSEKACTLSRKKGLDVSCRMILSDRDHIPEADVVLSVAVLEHIEDLEGFISVLKKGMKNGGRIIFCVPVQNYPGYDIFFSEHVWHMTTSHFKILFEQNGLKCIHADDSNAVNPGMGLFVCEKTKALPLIKLTREPFFLEQGRDKWLGIFNEIDQWVKKIKNRQIAVFGTGEIATLFLAFTDVGKLDILAFIDEDPSKIGTLKHGVRVFGLGWFDSHEPVIVLQAINPRYHGAVKEKLEPKGVELGVFWGKG